MLPKPQRGVAVVLWWQCSPDYSDVWSLSIWLSFRRNSYFALKQNQQKRENNLSRNSRLFRNNSWRNLFDFTFRDFLSIQHLLRHQGSYRIWHHGCYGNNIIASGVIRTELAFWHLPNDYDVVISDSVTWWLTTIKYVWARSRSSVEVFMVS